VRIVVSHLTRMTKGRICVAGIDLTTWQHIRPVRNPQFDLHLAGPAGGPFELGAVIELGSTRHVGIRPEIEDRQFREEKLRPKGRMPAPSFWRVLSRQAETDLRAIFGPDLHRLGHTWVVDENRGSTSLGCLAPRHIDRLWVNQFGRLRVRLFDGEEYCSLPVTDLRLFTYDHRTDFTPDPSQVNTLNANIQKGANMLLSVGLTRRFQRDDDEIARHWLQVNNIFLEDDPFWERDGEPFDGFDNQDQASW